MAGGAGAAAAEVAAVARGAVAAAVVTAEGRGAVEAAAAAHRMVAAAPIARCVCCASGASDYSRRTYGPLVPLMTSDDL